jgi:hypothetical protein
VYNGISSVTRDLCTVTRTKALERFRNVYKWANNMPTEEGAATESVNTWWLSGRKL